MSAATQAEGQAASRSEERMRAALNKLPVMARKWFVREMERRGLTLAEAWRYKLRPMEEGIQINYHEPTGADNNYGAPIVDVGGPYYKTRYYVPREVPDDKGKKKKLRYEANAGSRTHVYFTPLFPYHRHDYYVWTEGEFKAIIGCNHGFPVIGLQGVYNWKMDDGYPPEAPLIDMTKTHYIVFDADKRNNKDVKRAETRLANDLRAKGGTVHIVDLPLGGPKGLDDFILENGAEAFQELLDAAKGEVYEHQPELPFVSELNKKYFATTRSGEMVVVPMDNPDTYYNSRTFGLIIGDEKMATAWLRSPDRLLLDIVVDPDLPYGVNGGVFNTFKGFPPAEEDEVALRKMKKYMFEIWGRQLGYEDDEKTAKAVTAYLLYWMAEMLQTKNHSKTAVLMVSSETGTGKSLFGALCSKMVGEEYVQKIKPQGTGGFTGKLDGVLLAIQDEAVVHGEDSKAYQNLKTYITEDTVQERLMRKDPQTVVNRRRFVLTSNRAEDVHLEKNDRRFATFEPSTYLKRLPRAKRTAIVEFILGPGARALSAYLQKLDISRWDPEKIPETRIRQAVMHTSVNDWEDVWRVAVMRQQCVNGDVLDTDKVKSFKGSYRETREGKCWITWPEKASLVDVSHYLFKLGEEHGLRRKPPMDHIVRVIHRSGCLKKVATVTVSGRYKEKMLFLHNLEHCTKMMNLEDVFDELEDLVEEK